MIEASVAWVFIAFLSVGVLGTLLFFIRRTQRSEERFRLLAENASDMIALHGVDGRYLWVSPSVERVLGYKPKEMIGRDPHELVHPDDAPHKGRAARPSPEDTRTTGRVRKKDGSYVWLETLCKPLYKHGEIYQIQTAARDVSEMQEAKNLYRFLIQHLPNTSVFLFDRDFRHLVADGSILGKAFPPSRSLEGHTLWEVFPEDIAQVLAPLYQGVFEGRPKLTEQSFRTRTYRIHFCPVHGAGGEVALGMAFFNDVTEENSRTRVLEDRTQDLERSNRDLEQFGNVASHELKAPLRRISSFAELLAEEYEAMLSAEADDYIHHIIDGVSALQSVIESLLMYSRVQTKRTRLDWTDANTVFQAALRNLAAQIRETGAQVTVGHLPVDLTANGTLLRQLFENLVGNAIKFNDTGRDPLVAVSCRRDLLDWEFTVQDNGPGIDPMHEAKVFTMFSRLRPEIEGTGIGLALCKKIVGIHRGRIWYDSKMTHGTAFHFTIPARSPDEITQH